MHKNIIFDYQMGITIKNLMIRYNLPRNKIVELVNSDSIRYSNNRRIKFKDISEAAIDVFEITKEELIKNKNKKIQKIRLTVCVVARKHGFMYTTIAQHLRKHHTSIMENVRRAAKLININDEIIQMIEKLEQKITTNNEKKMQHRLDIANLVAKNSKDTTKVGAVLSTKEGANILTGYNGPPRGVVDSPDRFERPRKYLFASHAEQNIIAFAAREGIRTNGCTITVTHHPCSSCARSIIQAGITCVEIGDGKTNMPDAEFEAAAQMFDEAGIRVINAEKQRAKIV